jgi:hypothetical protein
MSMTDLDTLGPAMRALTEKQRRFVLAMASDPFGNAASWARAAGYSDTKEGAKVRGHHLIHDPRVEEAVREYATSSLGTLGPMLAASGMLRIAKNPRHPKHLRALELIANRVGMHEKTEHKVTVDHGDRSPEGIERRIANALTRLEKLGRLPALPPVVEVDFETVDDGSGN